jgi:exosortase/archaeosortase family protein
VSDPESQTSPPLPIVVGEAEEPPPGQEPWLRFALMFGFFAIISEVAYYAVALDSPAFESYLDVLAAISGWVLNSCGMEVKVVGTQIVGSDFAVAVAQGCDAIQVCSLLAAAVLAFPVSWGARFRGLAIGTALLQILNILRIVTLYWMGAYFSNFFKTAHEVVWPGTLIVATVVTWILWVRWETLAPSSVSDAA